MAAENATWRIGFAEQGEGGSSLPALQLRATQQCKPRMPSARCQHHCSSSPPFPATYFEAAPTCG